MFRLSQYMREAVRPSPNAASPYRRDPREVRPVVIWNLTRRCNLKCRHCYTTSADVEFPGELTSAQAMAVLDDLSTFGIPALILSGGEPLVRHDFFDLAARARELKFRHLSLSTNGTRLNGETARHVADLGFDYVGISLDGIGATNDWFRGVDGAFAAAIGGIRTCKALGVKTGLRFTMTNDNAHQLRDMVKLCESEGVDKFYLSHLVYAGRGDKHRRTTRSIHAPAPPWTSSSIGLGSLPPRGSRSRSSPATTMPMPSISCTGSSGISGWRRPSASPSI
ncbi:MAG: radical SAM protein [Hyphomicrobiaceae bacterium]